MGLSLYHRDITVTVTTDDIPDEVLDFCRKVAKLAHEAGMHRAEGTITPFHSRHGSHLSVRWTWEAGRHDEDADEMIITSTVTSHTHVDIHESGEPMTLDEIQDRLVKNRLSSMLTGSGFYGGEAVLMRAAGDKFLVQARNDVRTEAILRKLFRGVSNVEVLSGRLGPIKAGFITEI